ncbi:MAG: ATP-grasp domain-containing protein [Candidatus Nanohaloarchaea archaeon]|nr:ATP-grasp domain-containing protein [Candidatus Nanohaloarchaea archaeon]
MDLLEFEGKKLFHKHGIEVPEGAVFSGKKIKLPEAKSLVVKAQVPAGKREEKGGIRIVSHGRALEEAEDMIGTELGGELIENILIEEEVEIAEELYISLSINRMGKNYQLVFSEKGGSGIEEISKEDPEAIHAFDFYSFEREEIADRLDSEGFENSEEVAELAERMHKLMRDEDALLVEINPLVLTESGKLVAADSKVRLDDNAFYRHEYGIERIEAVEKRSGNEELEFVDLEGNIGIIGNGAGLVMATLDSIDHFGGQPADFLDVGGGADFEKMKKAMSKVMEQEDVEGLFVNIFGGITKCDEIAKGIIDFRKEKDMEIPMVVRMVGTNQEEGRKMLEDEGIPALDSMDRCAEKIVELVGGES